MEDYHKQKQKNETSFKEFVKQSRPDIFSVMEALDNTRVNSHIVVKTIYSLFDVATDTRFGNVSIEIEDGIARFIRGIKANRINTIVIQQENE